MSVEEHFMDCGVQTEDSQILADQVRVEDDGGSALLAGALDAADTSVSSVSSLVIHTRPPTPTSAPSECEVIEGKGSPPSIQTKTRTMKHPQLVYLRPAATGAQTLKPVSPRIVSLPETVSKYSAKQETISRRVVSMPEGRKGPLPSPQTLSPHMDHDSFVSEMESPARVRVHSAATDIPYTPSPPSSPESVVFIANKSPLAEQFLRKKVLVGQSRTPEPRDDDWAAWAKSPPRPIPALHGPLSLPYARCPSGAEGTLIEEQENLSRVIWGLETSDNAKGSKEPTAQASNDARPAAPPATRKQNGRQKPTTPVPPRFTGQKDLTEAEASQKISATQPQLLSPESDHYLTPPRFPLEFDAPDQLYMSLPSHGPIDLSELMRPRNEVGINAYLQNNGLPPNSAFNHLSSGLRTYGSSGDLGLDWTAFIKPQDCPRTSLSGSAWSYPGNTLGDYVGTSGLSPSLSMRSLLSSRSPIILEPPGQLSHGRLVQHSPLSFQHDSSTLSVRALPSRDGSQRSLSALEIAQKYRHQQMIQQRQVQSMLPTPPNSASPIWSSGFSPYQGSLLSPEVLTAARLPSAAKDLSSQQSALLQQAEVLQRLRTADHARLGVSGRNAQAQTPFLAPAARIQDHISDVIDLPLASNSLNGTSYTALPLSTHQPRNVGPGFLSVAQQHRSPAYPRPPPNTPHAPVDTRYSGSTAGSSVHLHGTALPTSPKTLARGKLPQQNPRSVPLARLVQRRLSAVPEEDSTMLPDNGRIQSNPADLSVVYHMLAPARTDATVAGKPHYAPAEAASMKQQRRKPTPSATSHPSAQPKKSALGGQQHHRQAREDKGSTAPHAGLSNERTDDTARSSSVDSIASQRTDPPQGLKRGGFRGRGRGWRGRKANAGVHGPERADGGLTVRS
ncbi:uncharacterized protein PHACADRAFT_210292 [Phanerochaete carnosa HHB-10118-sp]|uniref:Uncharacterized protein n=1 Tax=Phanerochaete carnosa (strain HHB-10118-sp) TaxID=650164 RepID=K5W5R9_PHACS|nr:uncharacterized protein PHACADRAFT_210292 [Phanerochaete carnosa HHB-10118-sp]EKM54495.1 hypothetical protein PHACADRAFT_210292 [Phanerochaete carnosa HHB-10118-sp]